jgi:thioredoxin 1
MPVLFFAEWCPFCRSFYPRFESALGGKSIAWAQVDISNLENPLWETFDIDVVPTIIIFKEGQQAFRKDGVLGRGLPEKAIDEALQEMKALETQATR